MTAASKPGYLFILPWALNSPGGVNQVVMNLYRECERAGQYDPYILIMDWSSPEPELRVEDGFKCIHLRVAAPADAGVTLGGVGGFLRRVPSALGRLRDVLAKYDVRVINAHYPTLSVYHFTLLRGLGLLGDRRLVFSFHGLDVRNAARRTGLEGWLWRRMMRSADVFVPCSDALSADVEQFAPEVRSRIRTVRNGVDVEWIRAQAATAAPAPAGARRYMINIGTYEHKKGHDVLMRAFSRIADEFPDIDLVIVGRSGPTRSALETTIRELGLAHRVRCLVDVTHREALCELRDATLFALPSRAEGLPIVILEAGALGIPVVASRVDGVPEVIESDEQGLLVPVEDDKALESALRALLSDAGLRRRMAERLQSHVASNFSWRSAWQQYVALSN